MPGSIRATLIQDGLGADLHDPGQLRQASQHNLNLTSSDGRGL